jgi:alanine racemase
MSRPARALLDAAALSRNFEIVRRHATHARVMAVVKANGYGHGLVWVARTLTAADAFGVASAEEGAQLRESGVGQPICLLEGFFDSSELPLLVRHRLSAVVHHEHQLRILEQANLPAPLSVWIKLDTGMHRIGFPPETLPAVRARLKGCPGVAEIRLMSHLANADNKFDGATKSQIDRFLPLAAGSGLEASLANSAAVLSWPQSHCEWVRPGIMLYGASPLAGFRAQELGLTPVMTLQTALIAVNPRRQGEAVGYGGDFHCPEDMPVGVAAIGYGDGYPRRAAPGTPVLVNGSRVPLIGRVSMDMITLDLRTQPQARVGDPVVLWGAGLPVDEVAAAAGTIGYELLCQVAERIPRTVVDREQ